MNKKGVTLLELMVGMVTCGLLVGAIYQLFISQSKAYTSQEQVVEVQQGIRGAMEILLRDIRMTGYDNDSINSKVTVLNPIVTNEHAITVDYEYDFTHRYSVDYWIDANARLVRQLTVTPDIGPTTTTQELILDHVETLHFTYGIDENDDNVVDNWTSAVLTGRVIAVRVGLTARADPLHQDASKQVSPRTLTSVITMRNLCLKH
jgi:type IV pilus assembly protein PilW